MLQGQVRQRPPKNRSQAHKGIHPISPLTHRTQRFQPLPAPLGEPPYHYDLKSAVHGIDDSASQHGRIVFHTAGDTGGVKSPDYQTAVAAAMKDDLKLPADQAPSFFYHLGDVVYYNGEVTDYYDQFYDPYDHYTPPIISIPGNHDGDPVDASETSLGGWVAYFMTAEPHVNPDSRDAPRVTMSLPNVYFTLNCPFVTIIGMYTNVPDHGSIDSVQLQWLTHEFATAPKDKALILALHHPIYSFDDHHSGSPNMADAVDHAINDSRRVPNLVLAAHVHNFQRIERPIVHGTVTPFLVVGHGGYFNLHHLHTQPGPDAVDPNTQAHLVAADARHHGYLTLTVDAKRISGRMTTIASSAGPGAPAADTFSYPAAALMLPDGVTVTL